MPKGRTSFTRTHSAIRLLLLFISIYSLSLKAVPTDAPIHPTNDSYTSAILLPDVMLGEPQTYSSVGATREADEPDGRDIVPNFPAVWWQWRPSILNRYTTFHAGSGRMAIFRSSNFSPGVPSPWVYIDGTTNSPAAPFQLFLWEPQTDLGMQIGRFDNTIYGDFTFVPEFNYTYWIADLSSTASNTFTIRQYHHTIQTSEPHAEGPTTFTLSGDESAPYPDRLEVTLDRFIEPGQWSYVLATNIDLAGSNSFALTIPQTGRHRARVNASYNDGRNWSIDVNFLVLSANDHFDAAKILPSQNFMGSYVISTVPATTQRSEPLFTYFPTGRERSVWFRWTPAENSDVRFKAVVTNSVWNFHALRIDVFSGASLSGLTRIANNWDHTDGFAQGFVPLHAVGGQVYHIRIMDSRPATNSASIALTIEPLDAPAAGYVAMAGAKGVPTPSGTNQWEVFSRVLFPDGSPADAQYRTQFYYGRTVDTLQRFYEPVAVNWALEDDPSTLGSFLGAILVSNEFLWGDEILMQARAWNFDDGYTYEEARAAGGLVGRSRLISMRVGSELTGPSYPTNIGDVHLRYPPQPFSAGRLEIDAAKKGFRLIGEPGIYAIEPLDISGWRTWRGAAALILTNLTGEVAFNLPVSTNETQFYGSRLID